jgi:hypothetical protein
MVIDSAINAPAASAAGHRPGGRHFRTNLSIGSAPGDACRRISDEHQSATKLQHLPTW